MTAVAIRALVVEDDDRTMPRIEDELVSLGHEFDWAQSQEDAQKLLGVNRYDYVLLDLEIPTKAGRGGASVQYGLNLAEHIHSATGKGALPVIVMTGHSEKCVNMVEPLNAAGVRDFISKPFPETGRTLAFVIKTLLGKPAPAPASPATAAKVVTGAPQPFQGGELVFYPDRIDLCGVTIISDKGLKHSLNVMAELRKKENGRYVRRSAPRLVERIGAPRLGTITGCVKTIRDNIVTRLREELGLLCGREDVLAHAKQGYCLEGWITVRDGMEGAAASAGVIPAQPVAGPDADSIRRQEWALEQLRAGKPLRRTDLEAKFDVSERTAKRDLGELVKQGKVKFVRSPHPGHYTSA